MVPIQIEEAALLHKSVVLRWLRLSAASLDGRIHNLVQLGLTVYRQRDPGLDRGRIGDRPSRKLRDLGVCQQHEVDVFGDDDTGRGVIRELLIQRESKRFVERDRLLQMADGQVDEDFLTHGWRPFLVAFNVVKTGRHPRRARLDIRLGFFSAATNLGRVFKLRSSRISAAFAPGSPQKAQA